ncbi:EAL domain-containing protein [Kangiella koreensis]|uniref:Diguanylate phosphodiesterase n=1 Tax=Kangiella koreensis (strain DSM 16069 / JCM 12317 / KCTC 12182 / SW-125) TaxID=523791 RepID=C7R6X5_KANKD|nr:EAL domain-containing protein [Kangiella koreensis]ACV25641.1 diguanylate phosphodiesterase [Kangiella koreensis DSM 16069]
MLSKLSNGKKLLWSFLTLLWFNFVVFAALTYFAQREQLLENAFQQLTHQSEIAGNTLDEWMLSRAGVVTGLANEIAAKPPEKHESIPPVYFERIADTGLLQYLGYGLENGFYTSNPWPLPDGYDPRLRPWYRNAKEAMVPTISEPYLGVDDYTTTYLAFTAPIIMEGQFYGVVTGDVTFNDIHQKILSTPVSYNGQFNLIKSNGDVVLRPVDPNDPKVPADFFSSSIDSGQLRNALSATDTTKLITDNTIVVLYPLEHVNWWLSAEVDKRALFAPVYRNLTNILLLFMAIALSSILLHKIFTRRIYKPILRQIQMDYHTDLPNKNTFMEQMHKLTLSNLNHGLLVIIQFKRMTSLLSGYSPDVINSIQHQTLKRIKNSFSRDYIVGSIAHDQLAIFVPFRNTPNSQFIDRRLQHLSAVLNNPLHISHDGQEQEVVTPINLASVCYPEDGGVFDLIHKANIALSTLENTSAKSTQYHSNSIKQLATESNLVQAFHHALKNNELSLVFQPQIDCETSSITGVEVFSRWYSKQLNRAISPLVFVQLAEKHHLIREFSIWLLHSLFENISSWLKSELPAPKFAINLSSLNLHDPVFMKQFFQLLKNYRIPAEILQIEITEHISLEFFPEDNNALTQLKNHGISLAIDDFGTGYSSLSYLKHLPIDTIKIDRSFIKSLPNSYSDLAISKAIIDIGREFNLDVVAEGVETQAQLQLLKQHGCYHIQGFLFSEPLSAQELKDFSQKWNHGSCDDLIYSQQ